MKITLKALRTNSKLTLEEASKQIGISRETLRSYEYNKTYPDVKRMSQILRLYNVDYHSVTFSPDYKEIIIN